MIKIHPPKLSKITIRKVNKVLKTNWLSTAGSNIAKLESELAKAHKIKYCCATINGTSALDLAIKSIKKDEESEIITSSISWISTVNAILYNNIKPIFLNVDHSLNLNLEDLETFLINNTFVKNRTLFNRKTKKKILAIVYTNLYGKVIDIKKLKKIIRKIKAKIYLIEDAAESMGAYYPNTNVPAASLADISCLSFNANKIITSSCGGAILTNNKKLFSFCSHKANQCKLENFTNDDIGYNYKITNLNATILLSEFKLLKKKISSKKNILRQYNIFFKDIKNIQIINNNEKGTNNWLINVKFNFKKDITKKIIKYLIKKKIETRPIFTPFVELKYLKKFQKYKVNNLSQFTKNIISIPSGPDLKFEEIKIISKSIIKFVNEQKI